ncbi:MAG: hypothetical protein WA190_17480 [Usitatibacter sp.]
MKMLTLAAILAALAFPVAAQSTAKVEPQSNAQATTPAKATGKSGAKATKTHAKHKMHKKKPVAAKT